MEMAVGFAATDDGRDLSQFNVDESVLGKVYVPKEAVSITGPIRVRYERHPWIEQFEIDGIIALRPKRSGFGTKDAKGFVASLNSIYAKAYDDYADFDVPGYFAHVTEHFIRDLRENDNVKMFRKYCGFVENMWREGNEEIYHVAMDVVVPALLNDAELSEIFHEVITGEFANEL